MIVLRIKAKTKHKIRRCLIACVPIIIGVFASCIALHLMNKYNYQIDKSYIINIISTILDLWGTLLGFIITAESVLIAFDGNTLTKEIKETQHFKTVLFTYSLTCFELLLMIAVFLIVTIINTFSYMWMGILIASVTISIIEAFLCLALFALLIRTVTKK